jgi:hypothetical protein
MPGDVRFEPIVALSHAPTADENLAIGLARRGATRTTCARLRRGAVGFAVFLEACATTNTPQQDVAYERWAKCNASYVQLEWIDLDGRIRFRYSAEGSRQDLLRCLADAGRGGPPLPDAVGVRPPGGP